VCRAGLATRTVIATRSARRAGRKPPITGRCPCDARPSRGRAPALIRLGDRAAAREPEHMDALGWPRRPEPPGRQRGRDVGHRGRPPAFMQVRTTPSCSDGLARFRSGATCVFAGLHNGYSKGLKVGCPAAPGALPAQMPRVDARKAHIAQGHSRGSSHEPFHGRRAHGLRDRHRT
jgi:hypothetical protein